MRLTVRAPGREIDIDLGQNSTAALKAAETTALRLLAAMPAEQPEPEVPFGFAVSAVSADTERADPPPEPDDTDQE
ncbi:hypothetical protein PV516_18745 [Streptomyces scabiei]|uniref:hypothetical protein n=1 Tax=Streptomyces scabiei TaxID=1930 RepID=UPI0029B21CD3|nr:hypothetical protein [Streptomyces scabiei]MDX3165825.1 hypothetical protein [Streptomyces scabiei]